jgi:hypothetical protein
MSTKLATSDARFGRVLIMVSGSHSLTGVLALGIRVVEVRREAKDGSC